MAVIKTMFDWIEIWNVSCSVILKLHCQLKIFKYKAKIIIVNILRKNHLSTSLYF